MAARARLAPRGELPVDCIAYRTIGPFGNETLPAGLHAEHRLKEGTWGVLALTEGSLRFVWDDAVGGTDDLVAPVEFVVPPQTPHHVESDGAFTLTIAFHRA